MTCPDTKQSATPSFPGISSLAWSREIEVPYPPTFRLICPLIKLILPTRDMALLSVIRPLLSSIPTIPCCCCRLAYEASQPAYPPRRRTDVTGFLRCPELCLATDSIGQIVQSGWMTKRNGEFDGWCRLLTTGMWRRDDDDRRRLHLGYPKWKDTDDGGSCP